MFTQFHYATALAIVKGLVLWPWQGRGAMSFLKAARLVSLQQVCWRHASGATTTLLLTLEEHAKDAAHPALAAFGGLEIGQAIIALTNKPDDARDAEVKDFETVKKHELDIRGVLKLDKPKLLTKEVIKTIVSLFTATAALSESGGENVQQPAATLENQGIKAYQRACKEHLRMELKPWLEQQNTLLKSSDQMTELPGWAFMDIAVLREKLACV